MPDMLMERNRPALWFLWVIGGLALLWNGFGSVMWAGTTFLPDMFLDGLPASHRAYVYGLPIWSTVTWGVGVVGGTAASILLLLRNRLAVAAFALSLFGAVANSTIYFTDPPPRGFFNLPLTLFIIGFALFLFVFAHMMRRRAVF